MNFDEPPTNPIAQLERWIAEAAERTSLSNPNAMTLVTIDAEGVPSARAVLLKGLDESGAVFYTNRASRKGRALAANPRASLLFYWDELHRQVEISGAVTPIDDDENDRYFEGRPRESQIGAWASEQSEPIADRAALDARVVAAEKRFEGKIVPRPPDWGGYRVSFERIEFWQGQEARLHDRVVYTPSEAGRWTTQRLCP